MIKETITIKGKNVLRSKNHSKYMEEMKKLQTTKDKLETEKRLVTKNLRKTNDEIRSWNNWLIQN